MEVPCTEPPGPQTHEDTANELAERGRVDGVILVVLAVAEVEVVEG